MVDLTCIKNAVILPQTECCAYRDPAVFYDKGTFYLYCSVVEYENETSYFRIGLSKSTDLVNWSKAEYLTPRDKTKEYSSPGNLFQHNGAYYLCMQTYCRENGEFYGNEKSRVFTMKTTDFEHFDAPVLLKVKGDDVSEEKMGRMIDPYLVRDIDEPEKIWCFYKQNGVSYSYSYDMEHWHYVGSTSCGENVCVLERENAYVVIHSPENGIGFLKSKDLVSFEQALPTTYLAQSSCPWAKDRITAGFALDLKKATGQEGYLMFYHGDDDWNKKHPFGGSVAIAYTKDFVDYQTFV